MEKTKLEVVYVDITTLHPATYNPRKWNEHALAQLKESITKYGFIDPLIVNCAPKRMNIVVGGHMRLKAAEELGYTKIPVVFVRINDTKKEKELNLRLNKNTGEWDYALLSQFDETLLGDIGFSSEELDSIFEIETTPVPFDLKKELKKLDIKKISIKKGDIYELDGSRLMCGDSTISENMNSLMDGDKADMCLTDPPYILDYLKGKTKQKDGVTTGFGAKKNRRYLETDILPPDFTEKWMANVHAAAKKDFHIICYENWKNIPVIWSEMENYWKVKNMIVWHVPNRMQGFSAKYKFFNKHDIAIVGSSGQSSINVKPEEAILQEEYETALYAIAGKPHWEGYKKGKKICPTDFIEHVAADEKSSGQGIIFGTKPLEILMPYIKVLTKRDDLIIEPFGGSGSTLIASVKMKRRCYLMEKSPVYAEVIKRRWELATGKKVQKREG